MYVHKALKTAQAIIFTALQRTPAAFQGARKTQHNSRHGSLLHNDISGAPRLRSRLPPRCLPPHRSLHRRNHLRHRRPRALQPVQNPCHRRPSRRAPHPAQTLRQALHPVQTLHHRCLQALHPVQAQAPPPHLRSPDPTLTDINHLIYGSPTAPSHVMKTTSARSPAGSLEALSQTASLYLSGGTSADEEPSGRFRPRTQSKRPLPLPPRSRVRLSASVYSTRQCWCQP
ncbi:hypothetical protein B0H10DRAFT_662687 [Mycena sp. CBHHK59/15]|nr:hypothetical protein B0H10DRAFT_662687 [Mycena sp. CBHHK59/15]